MTQEQEIKGILVNFFREGTNGDYLDSLNSAIEEIQQVKNYSIPNVVGQGEQLPNDEEHYNPLDDADDPRTMGLNNG